MGAKVDITKYLTPFICGIIFAALGVLALIVEHDKDAFFVLVGAGAGMAGAPHLPSPPAQ